MDYNKPPLTVAEQVIKLRERGLKFDNEAKAQKYLYNISYYRLRAYTYPFQDNSQENHPFVKDVTFEQIIELYVFDRKLRLLIFDAIEKIEIALRTQIIYHYALKHGSHWQLKIELCRNQKRFSEHLDSLQKEIERCNETFIDHYNSKYSNPTQPPSWMSLEVSSIGLLSKIFQNLQKCPEKKAITAHFGLRDVTIIENWMLCFSTLRNICAHHGRVWNRRLTEIKLPTHPTHTFLKNTLFRRNKLYATLSCIQYVLKRINTGSTFHERLKELIETCPLAQIEEMGFPSDWAAEELWN